MIFTDGPFVTEADLGTVDSELPLIAFAQQINSTKTILNAIAERGRWLQGVLQRHSGRDQVLQWHEQSYAPTYLESQNRPRISLSQVIVDDPEYPDMTSDFKWLSIYDCLYAFFRDASRVAGDDRYQERQDLYAREVRNKYIHRLIKNGLPFIGRPLAAPGAVWEPNSGVWDSSAWTPTSGGTLGTAQNYDIAVSWLDMTQSQNNESAPSARLSVVLPINDLPRISIAKLHPPPGGTRSTQMSRVTVNSLTATHWNVYLGVQGGILYRQNPAPIPVATQQWTAADNTLLTAVQMGSGQWAERYITIPDIAFRG